LLDSVQKVQNIYIRDKCTVKDTVKMKDPGMKLYSSAGNRLTYTTKKYMTAEFCY